MAVTRLDRVGNGVTTVYDVSFTLGYLKKEYVYVYLEGNDFTEQLDYTWINSSQIELNSPMPAGVEFSIRRVVPRNVPVNDYEAGAILRESNLDDSFVQALMILEEVEDGYLPVYGDFLVNDDINMQGNRVRNSVPATDYADLVTLGQMTAVIEQNSITGSANGSTPFHSVASVEGWTKAILNRAGVVEPVVPDTELLSERLNALSILLTPRGTTADIAAGYFPVGATVIVTDRGDGPFKVGAGGTANGYNVIPAGGTNTASLQYSYQVNLSWILNGANTLKDFLPVLAARPIGGVCVIDVPSVQNPFKIPSWVTVKGLYKQDGWARQAEYKTPCKITLSNGANDYLVTVDGATVNWGLQDVVLDGNKDNQTSYGSGCIKTRAGEFRNFGGVVDGVKCVNPKGWGGYFTGGPLNVTNSFFMSGAVFVGCTDLKIHNIDCDGTDGLHCSLLFVKTSTAEACSNIFAYGWGEVDTTKQLQEQSASVATNGTVTVVGATWLYDEAPVSVAGTPSPVGLVKEETFFAKYVSAGNWELYTLPPSNTNAVKVTFDVAGVVLIRHGNAEEVTCLSRSSLIEINNFRSAGGKLQGIKYIATTRTKISASLWNNNLREVASVPAAEFIASSDNTLTGSLGELAAKVSYTVAFKDSSGISSSNNRIPDEAILKNTTTGLWILDQSGSDYKNRNRFNAIGTADDGIKRYSSVNKDKEPNVQMAFIRATADQVIPATTNTLLNIDLENATGVTKVGATAARIACTQQGLYEISGTIGLTAKPANDVLYVLLGVGSNPSAPARFYADSQVATISCKFYSTTEALKDIQVQIFSTTGVTVASSEGFTFLTLRKLADAAYTL